MNKKKHSKIIIIGSGPAGYTAAIYAARANLKPILVTGINQGGQLILTNEIENWPGNYTDTSGQELMNKMYKHVLKFDTEVITDYIYKVNFQKKPFLLIGEKYEYTGDSVIIATGSSPKSLGLDSEKKFQNKGVSTCATCDGFFYRNKDVAVVGGGNTALEESLYLSNIAGKVYLIHRRNYFSAEKILINRLTKKVKEKKIFIYKQHVLKEIIGNTKKVEAIKISNNQNDKIIKLSGVFIAIGHTPNTKIFDNQLEIINGGYIKIKNNSKKGYTTATSIAGIFAAGDVMDHTYRQAITSAATGCMAALDAEYYLDSINNKIKK